MTSKKRIWIYGRHAAEAALLNKDRQIHKVFVTSEMHRALGSLLSGRKLTPSLITNKELDRLLENATHQGVALESDPIFIHDIKDISHVLARQESLIILLDQLTDPQNIGNIIRSAHAFNADAILTPKDHSFSETSSLTKAACGAIERIPVVFITNLVSTIKMLKDNGYWIVGLDSSATTKLHEFKFTPKTVIILGSEGSGLRSLTQKNCDFLIKIAMNETAESINASNACAIAMYGYSTAKICHNF
jgi:23S rRNA (guanosine2251-2'-O)-methyltransferase